MSKSFAVMSGIPAYPSISSASSFQAPGEQKTKSKPKQKRPINSAHTSSSGNAESREPIDLPRRRRIKSAVDDSRIVSLSTNNTPWASKVWGETSYKRDYSPKRTTFPTKVRPTSATRMNNPHPSKMFMIWKIPTRIHPHTRAVQVDQKFLKDIQEGFYQDYVSDENKTGGAMHEVPITNVAKIPFPGSMKKLELTGKKMVLSEKGNSKDSRGEISKDKLLEKTLRPESYVAFQDWIQDANEEEKEVLAKMLHAAHIEDSRTAKALSKVFNQESMKYIREWMHGAEEKDLKIAMQVLEQLATRSRKYTHSESRSQSGYSHSKIFRSRTWPRQKPHVHGDIELGITGVSAMKLRPHSADKCSHCSSSNTIAVYEGLKRMKPQYTNPTTVLWHHKVKPPQVPRLLNRGSVFNLPRKPIGQHFALHPEWPIA